MNIIDIVILIALAWGAFRGFTKGFILQFVTFIALILGIWASVHFSGAMAGFLTEKLDITGKYLPVLAFLLIFILVIVVAHLVGMLLTKIFELSALGWLNRIGGILFGILKMAFIVSVIFSIQERVKSKYSLIPENKIKLSLLYKPVASIAPALFPHIKFITAQKKVEEATTSK